MSENGWIKLEYTTPVDAGYNVKVTDSDTNMRQALEHHIYQKGICISVHTIVGNRRK